MVPPVRIVSLEALIPGSGHDLWWLVEPPGFRRNVLDAFAVAYNKTDKLEHDMAQPAYGIHRHAECVHSVLQALRERGAIGKNSIGQSRVSVLGPSGRQVLIAVRRADLNIIDGGFSMQECKRAMVELSVITDSSMDFDGDGPFTVGALFLHRRCGSNNDFVEAWLVHRWYTEAGWEFIRCHEAAYLGSQRYRGFGDESIESEGESPTDL